MSKSLFGDDAAMSGDAEISACGNYRYWLTRVWGAGPRLLFIMLNPSTADSSVDDPTLGRCISFARDNQFGSCELVNLFAFRTAYPSELWMNVSSEPDEVNLQHIRDAVARASKVVVAWGASVRDCDWIGEEVADDVLQLLQELGVTPYCLGKTKAGYPRHPLFVPGGTMLRPFWEEV